MRGGWLMSNTKRFAPMVGLLIGMVGMMNETPAHAEVKIEKVAYAGWKDAYKLSNGTVDLVVVPSVCRIMRYGYQGGPNVLWENKTLAGTVSNGKPGDWRNVGGDKVWPWPQDDWGKVLPQAWPPPAAADATPFQAQVVGKDTLRISSSLVAPWGVRIVRDITLAPTGTAVQVVSKLVRETEADIPSVAPWTITQVPASAWVMARLMAATATLTEGYKNLAEGGKFKAVAKTPEGMLLVERNGAQSSKIGLDGDILASLQGDTLFTVRLTPKAPADNTGLTLIPGERAQFYSQPDDANAAKLGITPYIEMEFTAPVKSLKKGESLSLSLVWALRHLPEEKRNPAGVAATLKAM